MDTSQGGEADGLGVCINKWLPLVFLYALDCLAEEKRHRDVESRCRREMF